MGIKVYSLLWVMQDSYHQPYDRKRYMRVPIGLPGLQWLIDYVNYSNVCLLLVPFMKKDPKKGALIQTTHMG